MSSNEVRIIGGNWRGRKLTFPAERNLRPSLGRVRETLFNWLRDHVVGSRCLDLFAGSGALGFEALSRGAASATLVDSNRRTVHSLRENATRLAAEHCTVVCMPAARFLARPQSPWDLIFLDPPFQGELLTDTLRRIRDSELLAPDGLIYLETARRDARIWLDSAALHFRVLKDASAGEARFGLLAGP